MKKTFALALMLLSIAASAQNKAGGISADILKDLNASFEGNAGDRAIRNALNSTSMAVLAASADKSVMPDTNFSDEVKTNGRTDQKSSGRCWLFTGLNVLRAQMIARHNLDEFTFSQNYLFFYDQLEKSNLFLQGIIDTRKLPMEDRKVDWLFSNPIGDGGQFTGVSNLIMKYGVVPSEAMPETYSANNTSAMRSQLSLILREGGLKLRAAKDKDVQALKVSILKDVYRVYNAEGRAVADLIVKAGEEVDLSRPYAFVDPVRPWKSLVFEHCTARKLQEMVVRGGQRVFPPEAIQDIAARVKRQMRTEIWEEEQRFENPHEHYLDMSPAYYQMKMEMLGKVK